ncbi:hypothetical protein MPTK1_2g24610 [Marchantia polymorpha subsp. ruderalis]|uniref:Uncharacterized protein n=2 Tax=Marchantia polymorpha TaxID=3197 RepID=A0A176VSK4_MARPO|nr:hypothetical protein AXG93_3571s1080 [Marchantia polymorpha subsp. ruderalis]PTQ27108.1 hypothetical protein MARPO_0221s0003 [Marchantia polymorpha]BBN03575.1 hypothetical protein Mp_2g24610 [Marchantia polymorpha subsp. ruderalis]|eukprot:PTQ27108.1 hypothetical protein MARPO_0221s0003 [Marchantia polymorpha]
MALSRKSAAASSRASRRPSADPSARTSESPSVCTRSKKLRSSENVAEAAGRENGDLSGLSTKQSRISGGNCNGVSGDSNPVRQALAGIQNMPPSFMTRARKSRTEQRLAKVLNWNDGGIRSSAYAIPSQESRSGQNQNEKKSSEAAGSSIVQRESSISGRAVSSVRISSSSDASFSPSGIPTSDKDSRVDCTESDAHNVSPCPSDTPNFSEVNPSSLDDDVLDVCVRQEDDVEQNSIGNSGSQASILSEARPSSVEGNILLASQVTPARRVLSRLAIDGVRTPEHLVPALGGGLSPNNDEAASEGIFRVYERRTSEQPAKISNRAKTCPQLRGSSTSSSSMIGTHHYSLRHLKDFSTPQTKVRHGRRKTPSSQVQSNMLLPESYREEKCAYFAEVDAFELLEEEADEEELEEPTKNSADIE